MSQFLSNYPRPAVTVDLVIMTIVDGQLRLLLIRRGEDPFRGRLALPGGFLRVGESPNERGEDLDEAARRELEEETGLRDPRIFLKQLGAFGHPDRDPRGRVITVAYCALIRPDLSYQIQAGGDAASVAWHELSGLDRSLLAFDHSQLIDAALVYVRDQLERSNLAFELVTPTFSIPELRTVFEILMEKVYDPGNFRRRFQAMVEAGLIEEAPGKRVTASKPAQVYRFVRPQEPPQRS